MFVDEGIDRGLHRSGDADQLDHQVVDLGDNHLMPTRRGRISDENPVQELAKETGIPYQNLINLYLRDCVVTGRRPSLAWE